MIPLGILAAARAAAGATGGALTYIGHGNNLTTTPIGAASPTRTVIVAWMGEVYRAGTPSVVVGGVSATIDTAHAPYLDTYALVGVIAHAAVPVGDTGAVAVSFGAGTVRRPSVAVWAWHGAPLTASGTATDIDNTSSVSLPVASVAGGPIVAVVSQGADWSLPVTWTGAEEDFDGASVAGWQRSGASTIAAGTTTSISAALGTTYGGVTGLAVAYGAA